MAYDPNLAIDIEKILRPRVGNKVPKFVYRWLKKLIHQDYLNGAITQGYMGVEFCDYTIKYLGISYTVKGLENIDTASGKKYTIVSNHPLGGIDGVLEISIFGHIFPEGKLKFPVNDFLMALPGLRPFSVPVNKIGGQARNLSAMMNELFASDDQILIFPAGLCSRRYGGKIQDLPWKKTFITKSVQNDRYIVPVHFIGRNTNRFYIWSKIRNWLGIKVPLEMALLPDELYRGRGKTYHVIVGEPIPASFFDSSKTPLEWAEYMRQKVYELK